MEKLNPETPDLAQEKLEALKQQFPEFVTEGPDGLSLDLDQMRQEFSSQIVEGPQERYVLDWPGKREAAAVANQPTDKTLRPAEAESVDFDNTQNLFIEGDNLEALKLIQETYLGQVKMIYIDPPYNTGKDFVYRDNFTQDRESYAAESGARDEDGNRLLANPETSGRFHSNWLSMMYPRLKLAKSLLADDGVIFISIDDGEVANLRRLCDEVFGAGNFEGHIHWRRRHNQPNDRTKMLGLVAEHVISYARDKNFLKSSGVGKVGLTGTFSNPDNDPRGSWASKPWKVGSGQSGSRYVITLPNGKEVEEEWMGDQNTYLNLLNDNRIVFPERGQRLPRKKYYEADRQEEGQAATNWWPHDLFGSNQEASDELAELMGDIKNTFDHPKPIKLISNLSNVASKHKCGITLDFFAGSATTAHAVMQLNAEDGGNRRFIMVQLPECCDEKSEAAKAGYATIAEISKERIRRAGKKIIEGAKENKLHEDWNKDIGFRVLKVDESNLNAVRQTPDATTQESLLDAVENIKPDRSEEDLLFDVMRIWGVDLAAPIERRTIDGKTVFLINEDDLVACFDTSITEDFVRNLTGLKPLKIVFRDDAFASDDVKINTVQIFKQASPDTEVRSI